MVFHIYALVGMTMFNINFNNYIPITKYETCKPNLPAISDFTTYENALIKMLMVVTENGWSNIIYDYAAKFQSFTKSMMFFHSFYLLVKYIILSLLTGLVWEIFTIISNNLGKKPPAGTNQKGAVQASDHSSSEDLSSDEKFVEKKTELEELVNPIDQNILFLRQKLKETKTDTLKMHEVILMRDDYSYANNKSISVESFKQIDGNA